MKELLNKLKEAEIMADKADAAWEADPENEELEKAFDNAYKKQWIAFEELVNKIVEMTSGEIDKKTAAAMVREKRNELESIIKRMA